MIPEVVLCPPYVHTHTRQIFILYLSVCLCLSLSLYLYLFLSLSVSLSLSSLSLSVCLSFSSHQFIVMTCIIPSEFDHSKVVLDSTHKAKFTSLIKAVTSLGSQVVFKSCTYLLHFLNHSKQEKQSIEKRICRGQERKHV